MAQFLRETFGFYYSPVAIPLIRICWIIVIGAFILKLIDSGLARLLKIIPTMDPIGAARIKQRTETLRHIVQSVGKGITVAIVALSISSELGFNIGPILGTAGIVGVALGFGAQSLVKDLIAGFFILFEDQYGVGDGVKVGELSGVVERMTLRVTVLRNLEGQVHVIPNGSIHTVTVMTKDWARAVLDVTVPHKEQLSRVIEVLQRVGSRLAQDWPDRVLDQPSILGVEKLDESGVTVRSIVKTPPFKQADVMREWRRRVKDEFDRSGIEFAQRNPGLTDGKIPVRP